MRIISVLERMKQAFAKFWRQYIVDEDPDERIERIRRARIENLKINSDLLESMRLYEKQQRKAEKQSLAGLAARER